jgi:hypothetical protein
VRAVAVNETQNEVYTVATNQQAFLTRDARTGALLNTTLITGLPTAISSGNFYGAFATVGGKVFIGLGKTIYRVDMSTGAYDGFQVTLQYGKGLDALSFNGRDICMGDNIDNYIYCWQVVEFNVYGATFAWEAAALLQGDLNIFGAAAGTIYWTENKRPPQYREVKFDKVRNTTSLEVDFHFCHMDNRGFNVPGATMILEEGRNNYHFDELLLTGYTRLVTPLTNNLTVDTNVTIDLFLGDLTGLFHILNNTLVFVEYVESVSNITFAPCGFRVDAGGEIIFPTETHLRGVRGWFDGLITGVEHLYLSGADAMSTFTSTAQTAFFKDGVYFNMTTKGTFNWATVTVKRGSCLNFSRILDHSLLLSVGRYEVMYQGTTTMNHGEIEVGNMEIESEGWLTLDGTGPEAEQGDAPGLSHVSVGSGAGHGGIGGGVNETHGGAAYGSVYFPFEFGSGGGNGGNSTFSGVGGAGGGRLRVVVGDLLELQGLVSANGGAASGKGNAGGGSGGSIVMQMFNMTGHGEVSVHGGNGQGRGFGGAGGRGSLLCRYRFQFGGDVSDYGGTKDFSDFHQMISQ